MIIQIKLHRTIYITHIRVHENRANLSTVLSSIVTTACSSSSCLVQYNTYDVIIFSICSEPVGRDVRNFFAVKLDRDC